MLDVANLTAQEMELHYTPTKNMLIEGHESCRVPIPVDRCPLSKLTKSYMDHNLGLDNRLDLDKICSDHIANLVDLRWQLLATETKGRAVLKGITLTPPMLDIVRMSPLTWGKYLIFYAPNILNFFVPDVSINGDLIKPQEAVNCEAGECVKLHVSVGNRLEKPIRQLNLSIQFYQDYQNGTCNYKLESRLATAGATR